MWRRSKIVPQKPHRVHSFGGAEEVKVKKSHAEEKRCVSQEQDSPPKAPQGAFIWGRRRRKSSKSHAEKKRNVAQEQDSLQKATERRSCACCMRGKLPQKPHRMQSFRGAEEGKAQKATRGRSGAWRRSKKGQKSHKTNSLTKEQTASDLKSRFSLCLTNY